MFSRFFFLFSRWSCPEILFASDMVILYLFCFAYIQSKTFRRAGTKHIKQDTFKSIRKTEYILHIWNDNFDLSLFFYPFLSLPPICFLTLCIIHDSRPLASLYLCGFPHGSPPHVFLLPGNLKQRISYQVPRRYVLLHIFSISFACVKYSPTMISLSNINQFWAQFYILFKYNLPYKTSVWSMVFIK